MKAWSLAWNLADIPLSDASVHVIRVRRTGKGCLSYVVRSGGQAAVIDPSVSSEVYIAIAKKRGWSVRYSIRDPRPCGPLVARSGTRQADRCDVAVAGATARQVPFSDRSETATVFPLRGASITAMHTPGHTNESTSYLLNQAAVFTGDTLFTNGVGRPDLHADPEAARQRARALFLSLTHLHQLRPEIIVLPAHASEPIAFDGQPVAARLADVTTWLSGWMASEPAFVERVTSNLPATPPNFVRIVDLNEAGEFPTGDPTELEAGANRCAVR